MTSSPDVDVALVPAERFAWGSGVAEQVRRVIADAARSDGREPVNEAAQLSLRHDGLARSALWTASRGGEVVGFALVSGLPAREGTPAGSAIEADLVVAPAARGRGVGGALAAAVLRSVPDTSLSAWSHGNHPAASRLAERLGFRRVRDLWVMRRDMSADLPRLPARDDVRVRTFRPGRDEESVLAVNAAAFASHPEQGALSRADLEQRMAEPWFDPDGFFLAERAGAGDGELLGFHWTKVHADDPPYGEVYVVGIAPAAQGLGLGTLLTLVGLHYLRDRGLGEVILYVESDNAPAVAVYSRLGFTHAPADTDVRYAR